MNITLTRIDGGLHINPAPPYIARYLRYSHRSFKTVNYRRVNSFEERSLHTSDFNGGLYTLQGFFEKICKLIHEASDTYKVEDLRTPLPPVDWKRVKEIGLRDYQVKPLIEFFSKANNSGVVFAPPGFGKTYCEAITYAARHNLNTVLAIPYKEVVVHTWKNFKLFLLTSR